MKNNSPFFVSVTGWSGSGKTAFCEKIISELQERGYRIAAAKKTHHQMNPDNDGSDSRRFFDAGAKTVCLGSDDLTAVYYRKRLTTEELGRFFTDSDIVIAEGFKPEGALRIEAANDLSHDFNGTVINTAGMDPLLKNDPAELDILLYSTENTLKILRESTAGQLAAAEEYRYRTIQRDDISCAAELIIEAFSKAAAG